MNHNYIYPKHKSYDSVEIFLTEKPIKEELHLYDSNLKNIEFINLEQNERALILGEPGVGKSELLKEYFNYLKEKEVQLAFFDLKTLKFLVDLEKKRDSFFEDAIAFISQKPNKIVGENLLENNFDFGNTQSKTLILDGLDEIDTEYFEVIWKEIIQFEKKHNNIKVLVSCRSNYIEKYPSLFSHSSFKVISIFPFDFYQIGQYLEDIIDFDTFWKEFRNGHIINSFHNTFLNIPRYLKYFKELLIEKGLENIKKLGRNQIIEYVIYKRIQIEHDKLKSKRKGGSYNIEFIIQILERIALIMEMQEENVISRENFYQFSSDSALNLLNEINLTQIEENTILKHFDRHLQFDNTEFQEYLAAKQISRTNKYEQIFYELTIDENLKEFKFSWLNTLTYLVEIKPQLALPIIKLGNKLDDRSLFNVIRYVKPEQLSDDNNSQIFHIIFGHYNIYKNWIYDSIENEIAEYAKNDTKFLINKIKENDKLNESNFVLVGNTCIVISILLKNKIASSKDFETIKEILFCYYDTKIHNNDVVHRFATKCLIEILDKEEIKRLVNFYSKISKTVSDGIANGVFNKFPNEIFAINLYIKHLTSKSTIKNIYLLEAIESKDGLLYLLKHIYKEIKSYDLYKNNLIEQIRNQLNGENSKLLKNIKKNWNKDFESIIFKILYFVCKDHKPYVINNNKFLIKITHILIERTLISFAKILLKINRLSSQKYETYYIYSVLSNKSNYKNILNYILQNEPEYILFFLDILYSNNQEIYLKLKEDKEDYILKHEKSVLQKNKIKESEIKKDQNNSEKIYKKYINCIEKKHIHAINDYDLYKNDIKKFMTELDKNKLQNFIITKIFKELEPIHNVQIFIDSFNILIDLRKQNTKDLLKPYRNKIIQSLSFFEDYVYLKNNLNTITSDEIDTLIRFVEDNYSVLYSEYKIKYFFRFLQSTRKNIKIKILKDIINNNEYNVTLSIDALNLYSKDYLENHYLEGFLSIYGTKTRLNSLNYIFIYEVNKILVQNNSDLAVNWLIENIKFNKYQLKSDPNNTSLLRYSSNNEDVGKNIGFIKSFKYSDKLLELLVYSIELINSNYDYYEFVNKEIWGVYQVYCSNLELDQKEYLSFRKKLIAIFEENQDKFGVNWFKNKIDYILLNLKNKLSKNKVNISSTIQKYKELQEKKYLDICYPKDVLDAIKEVLEVDIKNEIKRGSFDHLFSSNTDSKKEDFYEKIFITQIENHLLKKGFRKNDIQEVSPKIYRQIQGLNDKRTDLLVSYGSIGSVLIELKKEYNKIDKIYKETKLKNYMEFTGADFCICLVINDKMNENSFNNKIAKYKAEIEDEIYSVIGLTFLTPPKKNR